MKITSLPNLPTDGVLNSYLPNDVYAVLLCDARNTPLFTANFLTLSDWPEDFENYSGRIVVIRSDHKKTRKRQRGERKIMWKSPRGWKVLKNVTSEDVMVQYRARSDDKYRYRMFCFRNAMDYGRDESLAILHVTHTPEHVVKNIPVRSGSVYAYNKAAEDASCLADAAAAYHDGTPMFNTDCGTAPFSFDSPPAYMEDAPPAFGSLEAAAPAPADMYFALPSPAPFEASCDPDAPFDVASFLDANAPMDDGQQFADNANYMPYQNAGDMYGAFNASGYTGYPSCNYPSYDFNAPYSFVEDGCDDEPPRKRQKTEEREFDFDFEPQHAMSGFDAYLPQMGASDAMDVAPVA